MKYLVLRRRWKPQITVDFTPCLHQAMIYCKLISPFPHSFVPTSGVSKRPVCVSRAAAISDHTDRDALICGSSFLQVLPLVIFEIKYCVSIPRNTFITMHPLEVYYLNQAEHGLIHSRRIGPVYSVPLYLQHGHVIHYFAAVCSSWIDHDCCEWPKPWVVRRCVPEARS